ncbi:hypothetical protein LOC67_12550 [Stieleria sp. JC731]|uniref:hypothetical protein n=1 Tax=Pirellulaceae TaxID=2691357 RepID=UPI001E2D32D2|nr:hypothetical protein [Stieleria sp. JC731]MCC9601377.1 hypothetical protein [Stieleria sp. JC731]
MKPYFAILISSVLIASTAIAISGCGADPDSPLGEAQQAQEQLEDARQEAAEMVSDAEEDALETIADAKENAEAQIADAQNDANELIQEAKQNLDNKMQNLQTLPPVQAPAAAPQTPADTTSAE